MALTISFVPDSRVYLGPSNEEEVFTLAPGVSDYPTGGYIITAAQMRLLGIYGAWLIGQNAASNTAGYEWVFTVAQASPALANVTQVALQAFGVTTGTPGVFTTEAASLTNFTGVVLTAIFRGY
jgi:hypothetical protein